MVKEKIKQIHINVATLFIAMRNKETPWYAKLAAGLAVAYALSPVDLVPDFIPVIGYLDDLIILPILIAIAIKLTPEHILEGSKKEAIKLWSDARPKSWYFSIPIVIIWVLIAILAYNLITPLFA